MSIKKRIKLLSELNKEIELQKPAEYKMILRSENSIPGKKIDKTLENIYKFSNGIRFYNYLLVGVRTCKYGSIESNVESLWYGNDFLYNDFIGFLTSPTINIGYLSKLEYLEKDFEEYPVALLESTMDDYCYIVASSVSKFIDNFLDSLENKKIEKVRNIYLIDEEQAFDIELIFKKDPELLNFYKSGVLYPYYKNNPDFVKFINGYLKNE